MFTKLNSSVNSNCFCVCYLYGYGGDKIMRWRLDKIIRGIENRIYSFFIAHRFANRPKDFKMSCKANLFKGEEYIKIGVHFRSMSGLRLEAYDEYKGQRFSPRITIGDHFQAGQNCHIGAINNIEIGNNVLLASKVCIIDHSHGDISRESLLISPEERKLVSKGKIVIGNNVWIGDGVVILSGVSIGNNAIIGANAVVTKDIPDNAVAVGIPAKVIKKIS